MLEEEPSQKERDAYSSEDTDDPNDGIPYEYCHIPSGPRSVKPEYYTTKTIPQSEYPMSDEQSDESILVVANHFFGKSIHSMKNPIRTPYQHTATEDVLKFRWRQWHYI